MGGSGLPWFPWILLWELVQAEDKEQGQPHLHCGLGYCSFQLLKLILNVKFQNL